MSNLLETLPRPVKQYHSETYDRISKHHAFEGKGKTILITGGAGGIGLRVSTAFAAAGVAQIAIVARSAQPLQEAKTKLESTYPSVQVLTYQGSITDFSRMTKIVQELGTIDILILNAAIAHRRVDATEIFLEEMTDAYNTNTLATFNLSKAFLALPTPPSGQRTIINVSTAATHFLTSARVGYGTSKAAGVQIMQQFAYQYKDDPSVRIFSFHPGAFYTPGVAEHFKAADVKWDHEDLPAHFALWLAGSESRFLHGRFVWANWDVDELIGLKERVKSEETFLTIGLIQ